MNEEEKERHDAIADIAAKIKEHEKEIDRLKFVAASYGWAPVKENPKLKPSIEFHPGKGWGPVVHQPTTKRLYYYIYNYEDPTKPQSSVVAIDCAHQPFCHDYEQHKAR